MDWVKRISKSKLTGEYEKYYGSDGKEIPSIYIGRQCNMGGHSLKKSKWCNPFTVKECGSVEVACWKFEQYVRGSSLLKDLEELDGKILLCWCRPGPCHGDVLLKLLWESKMKKVEEGKKMEEGKKVIPVEVVIVGYR